MQNDEHVVVAYRRLRRMVHFLDMCFNPFRRSRMEFGTRSAGARGRWGEGEMVVCGTREYEGEEPGRGRGTAVGVWGGDEQEYMWGRRERLL
jgi:hypothetical protein